MNCTQTGCYVFITSHNALFVADMFVDASITVFRIGGRVLCHQSIPDRKRAAEYIASDYLHWFDKEGKGDATLLCTADQYARVEA